MDLGGGALRLHCVSGGIVDYTNLVPQYYDASISSIVNGGYQIEYPSGARETFTKFLTVTQANDVAISCYFLTTQADPAGNTTTYNYSSDPNSALLNSVVDADGNTNYVLYDDPVFTNQITRVVDPWSRTTFLTYDQSGFLTNVVDEIALTNSFVYDPSVAGSITSMTTPYGTTSFEATGQNVNDEHYSSIPDVLNRAMKVTLPTGGHHLYVYRQDCTNEMTAATYSPVPNAPPYTSTIDNVDQQARNSFHWGPLQYTRLTTNDPLSLVSSDYSIGRLKHWLADPNGPDPSNTLSVERAPSADGGTTPGIVTWYDYAGKANGNNYIGASDLPSLVAVVLPDGSTRFTYFARNAHGYVTQEVSSYSLPNGTFGQRTSNLYYAGNNIDLQQWLGPNGEQVLSNYFSPTNVIHSPDASYDALNQQTVFTHNTFGQVTQISRPTGLTTVNTYATAGLGLNRITNTVDLEITRTNSFTYYANGLVNTHTDERGLTTTTYWDNLQRLTGTSDPDGTTTNLYYVISGVPFPNSSGGTAILDRTASQDRMGFWTFFTYDALRHKIGETNANRLATLYDYCDCGELMSITNLFGSSALFWTTFAYDLQGNQTNIYLPDSTITKWFDALQRVSVSFDSRGYRYYSYNNQGLLTTNSSLYGAQRVTVFDNEDRPLYVTDANGVTVTNTYDLLSRLTLRTYPDTGAEKFGYSARGLIAYTNQIGASNFFTLDQAGRKDFETNANGELLQFYYNPAGDLTNLVDGKAHSTKWSVNAFGRITNKVDQVGATILRYAYDPDNRLTNRWSAAMGNAAFSYDPVGNLTNISYDASGTGPVSFQYDALNRLTRMVDTVGTTVYSYTAGGELFTEDGPFASDTVTNSYVNRLRVALALQQPAGAWTNGFIYDAASRLTNVTSQAGAFGYNFALAGVTLPGSMLQGISLPNTAFITNQYDDLARLTGTFLQNSANLTLDSASYGYNLASQRTNFTSAPGDVAYGYDKIGQLKVATSTVSGENRGYAYDAAWNLNFRTNNGALGTFIVDTKNELTNAPTPMGTMLYDANGNLTSANGHYLYNYDAENRLSMWIYTQLGLSSLTNGDLVSTFAYDGLGRLRLRQEYTLSCSSSQQGPQPLSGSGGAFPAPPAGCNWDLTSETHYIYDGYRAIQERDSSNVPLVSYTRGTDLSGTLQGAGGIGGLLARSSGYSGGNWTSHAYYHADGGGNITYLVDSSQNLAASYRYDPFGNTVSSSGTLANANVYRFSSKEIHANSGMYYYLFRFFDPNLQRWINRDPIGEIGGINLYAFLRNSPVDAYDPLGLSRCQDLKSDRFKLKTIEDQVKQIRDNIRKLQDMFDTKDPDELKKLQEAEKAFDRQLADFANQERTLLKEIAELEDAAPWRIALRWGSNLLDLGASMAARLGGAVVFPNQIPYDQNGGPDPSS